MWTHREARRSEFAVAAVSIKNPEKGPCRVRRGACGGVWGEEPPGEKTRRWCEGRRSKKKKKVMRPRSMCVRSCSGVGPSVLEQPWHLLRCASDVRGLK